jgi:hypothetical protein
MSKDESYFQFPLALLAMTGTWADVVGCITSYSIESHCERLDGAKSKRRTKTTKTLGVKVWNWLNTQQSHRTAQRFLSAVPYSGTGDATVRIKTTLAFESRDGEGLDEREFKCLCAVYSALGRKEMRRITVDEVQRRAAGCVSKTLFDTWSDRGTVYSAKCIRTTLDELNARGFFARATYGRRLTYYTNRQDVEKLRSSIVEYHTKRIVRLNPDRLKDDAMAAQVAAKLSAGKLQGKSEATITGEPRPAGNYNTAGNYNSEDRRW